MPIFIGRCIVGRTTIFPCTRHPLRLFGPKRDTEARYCISLAPAPLHGVPASERARDRALVRRSDSQKCLHLAGIEQTGVFLVVVQRLNAHTVTSREQRLSLPEYRSALRDLGAFDLSEIDALYRVARETGEHQTTYSGMWSRSTPGYWSFVRRHVIE
jgi:hypothetical protein